MTAIPFPVGKGESEVSDRRQSAWTDPKTWIGIISVLLTILIYVGSVISRQLDEMNRRQGETNSSLHSLEVNQGKTNTHTEDMIAQLAKEQADQRESLTNQNAYNFNMNKAVTEMATTMRLRGMQAPQIPEPPKLRGQ